MYDSVKERYFQWMLNLVRCERFEEVCRVLDSINFTYILDMDANREGDGINLRYLYGYKEGIPDSVIACELDNRPCSVLEMMVALAYRAENDIMDDPDYGDRTYIWFYAMLDSMNLIRIPTTKVEEYVERMMQRRYSADGRDGALFRLSHPRRDMRTTEIWYQMQWFLSEYEEGAC